MITPVYSIVVPVFNSEKTLLALYRRLVAVMTALQEPFELIFVEDGGQDQAWLLLERIAQNDERVIALQLLRNVGQGSATLAGLAQATGTFIITLDDDLQHPPEEIPILIQALITYEDQDVVIGVPKVAQHHFFRRFSSNMINRLNTLLLKKDPYLRTTAFRIMRRQVVEALLKMQVTYPSLGPMILSVTQRVANVTVAHHARQAGQSGYTIWSLIRQSLSNMVGYSVLPLHLLAVLGLFGIVFCLVFGSYYGIRCVMGGIGMPPWTSLLLLMVLLSSFNFLAFSLLGEYVLRIMRLATFSEQWTIRHRIQSSLRDIPDAPKYEAKNTAKAYTEDAAV